MEDLDTVLKQLKIKKSCDPLGIANELFKPVNIGKDLKAGVLTLMNKIKKNKTSQKYSNNVTSLAFINIRDLEKTSITTEAFSG